MSRATAYGRGAAQARRSRSGRSAACGDDRTASQEVLYGDRQPRVVAVADEPENLRRLQRAGEATLGAALPPQESIDRLREVAESWS
ncbi:hypothetical protein TK50_17505 [Micromonospora haikouensis]|uniref:Uncharacterized protein n=1 Tax=Micromonospora haikouensis TaxID=686309 RepID=A0A0D0VPU1_9ACTN|nr:hypothetical protein TK50_17505 [Micromonospora haikouensis]